MDLTAPDRRTSNKARTRASLIEAVYDLLEEHPLASITAEQVADIAGISRRTFFNYFPSVEALVASCAQDALTLMSDTMASRPLDEPVEDSISLVVASIFTEESLPLIARSWRAAERSPAVRRFVLESNSDTVAQIARDWAQHRLRNVDPLRVSVITMAYIAAFDTARTFWMANNPGPVDADAHRDFLDTVNRAFAMVAPLMHHTTSALDNPTPIAGK